MAPSPLTQTIKLEKSLGAELFERNTRTVSLTAAGLSFLPHARKIIEEPDLARRAATTETGRFYGRLGFGLSAALNHKTLPPLARALQQRYPELELTLSVGLFDAGRHEPPRHRLPGSVLRGARRWTPRPWPPGVSRQNRSEPHYRWIIRSRAGSPCPG